MAEIRCPMCGRPNPAELETCKYCQARLKPLVLPADNRPPAPGTPHQENTGGFGGNVPDWLDSLRAAQGINTASLPPLPEDQPSSSTGEENWFSRIQERRQNLNTAPFKDTTPSKETAPFTDTAPSKETAPFKSTSDVSEWLHRNDRPAPTQNEPEGEPDWLESIRRRSSAEDASEISGSQGQAESANPPPVPASGDSDWLQNLRQSPNTKRLSPVEPESEFNGPPAEDWLARIGGEQAKPPETAASPAEFSGWLTDAEKPQDRPPEIRSAAPTAPLGDDTLESAAAAEEIPDWMRSLEPRYSTPEPPSDEGGLPPSLPQQPLAPASEEFAEFLKNVSRLDEPLPGSGFNSQPAAGETPDDTGSEDLPGWSTGLAPDWLADLEAKAGSPPPINEDVPSVAPLIEQPPVAPDEHYSVEPFISGALPDWLGELGTAERSVDQPIQPAGFIHEDNSDSIESAELPSWVQALRPIETVAPKPPAQTRTPAETHVEDRGPLAGLRGILPAEPAIIRTSRPPAVSTHLEISEEQERHSQILENLLASEGEAEELPSAPAISSQRMTRMVIAAVLLLAVLIPLLSGLQLFPAPTAAPTEVALFQGSIQVLPENAPVLMVTDYSPAVSGEMQAAASGVLTDLLIKDTRLTLISTTPTGAALGEHLLSSLIPATDPKYQPYWNDEKIVQLGYLPGGMTALAAFAADPQNTASYTIDNHYAWDLPGLKDVHAIADFARVIVLTENANTAQAWIEQVRPQMNPKADMLVVAGAQAAPSLRPYLDSHQLSGMVAGVAGGAAYEEMVGRPGSGQVYWNAFQFGTWAAVLIILIGGLAVSFRPALAAILKGEGS